MRFGTSKSPLTSTERLAVRHQSDRGSQLYGCRSLKFLKIHVYSIAAIESLNQDTFVTSCILFHTPELGALASFVFMVCGPSVSLALALLCIRE